MLWPVINLARDLERWNDLPAAARAYASAGRMVPELQLAHLGEGRALFALGRYQGAILALTRAVALLSPSLEAVRLLGQARFHAGDHGRIKAMDFRGLVAPEVDLTGRDLSGKDFSEDCLNQVHLDGAKLVGARFDRTQLSGTFVGADLSGANFERAQFG